MIQAQLDMQREKHNGWQRYKRGKEIQWTSGWVMDYMNEEISGDHDSNSLGT